ncbi:hypothetical protein ACSS6W_004279 [Trichoderma asperelloides]
MDPSQVPIAIIGAGPAGLSLARLLELAGIDYVVFERDESATSSDESSSSGTLDIHKDFGQAVLKEAGLLEEFQSIARYDVPIKIADAQGIVQADIPGSSNTDKPEIDRKDLRNLLLRSIPEAGDGSYHLSVGVKLIDSQAVKSGTVLHDPSTLWESLLQNEFVGWAQDLTEFIKSSALNFRSWPLYSTPKTSLPWKYTPGLTLLGDAAHLTVPTGDGVNNALNDSAELAKQIIKHGTGNLEAAVVDYEKATLPRAIKAIEKGHWFIQHFFGVDAPQEFLYAASAKDN